MEVACHRLQPPIPTDRPHLHDYWRGIESKLQRSCCNLPMVPSDRSIGAALASSLLVIWLLYPVDLQPA